ncbi:Ig-like domain-containing protein [Stigmatella sp. ncwal1]|uniref:Ig-like domain-containing protein n=1 Tax=Stigmatella ashevillensis TaxID=2995309 RepID=A0ABT5D9E7_9BACT|nr:Ig-like domain-containing protein [Stigmatella ashevillena]MDC0710305.1 Ig-like domain-containing protein [Stigmatella ashevillena]
MHLEHTLGFLPNIRFSILLVSCVLAACSGGEEKPTNKAPVAANDVATTHEDTAVVIPASTLVSNDTDADGDSLTVTAVGKETHGTVTLAGGNVTLTPETNFFGTATFEYTVSDGTSTSAATVTVTVNPLPDAPTAVADSAQVDEDAVLVIPATTLVTNDVDVDGDTLVVAAVGAATHGTVTLAGDDVTFTPEANFFGAATFEYTVSDGTSTRTATVTITVRSVNDAPVAIFDSAFADEDVELLIPVATLLSNDRDIEGDSLTVSQVANAHNGTVELVGDDVKFTPTPGFAGAAGFEYQVSDIHGATVTGPIALIVRASGTKQVVAGGAHTCAVFPDGRVKCWGANTYGQLGLEHGSVLGDGPNEMGGFLPFVGLGTGERVAALALRSSFTCALLERGAVKCWGLNVYGQLGRGDTVNRGGRSGEMGDALPQVDLGTGRTARALAAGVYSACAILENGTVKCWGYNSYGQLGLGDTADRGDGPGEMGNALPPVNLGTGRTAKALAMGNVHTCALLDDATVKCWGHNDYGQLGLGDKEHRGDGLDEMGDALPSVNLGTGRTAKALVAGRISTCALLDDATVKCWGNNASGQLGLGDRENRGALPGQMGDGLPPVNLGTGRSAMALSVGDDHACALLDDGSVKCWGENSYGSLGLGDSVWRGDGPGEMGDALPQINLGTGRTATSLTASYYYTCVTLDEGSVKCWGMNDYGKLGLGDIANRGGNPGEMGDALPAVEL